MGVSSSEDRPLEKVKGFFPLLPVFGSLLPVFVLRVVSDKTRFPLGNVPPTFRMSMPMF